MLGLVVQVIRDPRARCRIQIHGGRFLGRPGCQGVVKIFFRKLINIRNTPHLFFSAARSARKRIYVCNLCCILCNEGRQDSRRLVGRIPANWTAGFPPTGWQGFRQLEQPRRVDSVENSPRHSAPLLDENPETAKRGAGGLLL